MIKDIPILLETPHGEPLKRLDAGALAVWGEAEQVARDQNLAKREAVPHALREHLERDGFVAADVDLAGAAAAIEAARRGPRPDAIRLVAQPAAHQLRLRIQAADERTTMPDADEADITTLFEVDQQYPLDAAKAWYDRLVGLDELKRRLLIELEMLLFPELIETWSATHHGSSLKLLDLHRNRVPLVILEGDVGTGKTALAHTIGDALARRAGSKIRLLKMNTQVRGKGHVGEMSDLLVRAFTYAEEQARSKRGSPVLLVLDEADALAGRRDTEQMHHEDKAGINTVLQRLDNLRLSRVPLAVIFITNRPDALDPAVRRRAALSLSFERPNDAVRAAIFRTSVPELGLTDKQVADLVKLTGPRKSQDVPFTASDITDRLLPSALREAYSDARAIVAEDLLSWAERLEPSPQMGRT